MQFNDLKKKRQTVLTVLLLFTLIFFSSCKKSTCWGGIVSHHELAHDYIEDFFSKLEKERQIETFFIICPSHFGLSTQEYSMANYTWTLENGKSVKTNVPKLNSLMKSLNVISDEQVFPIEHGASTLMPYIKRHFPEADVVVIAVTGEPPMNIPYAQNLSNSILPFFDEKGMKENFLLISSDFAHHGNEEQTMAKDERSALFFDDPRPETSFLCGCDNRPGIFVLSKLCTEKTKANVLSHTNSFEINGEENTDITSYFFVLMKD